MEFLSWFTGEKKTVHASADSSEILPEFSNRPNFYVKSPPFKEWQVIPDRNNYLRTHNYPVQKLHIKQRRKSNFFIVYCWF